MGVLTARFVLQSSFEGPSADRVTGILLNDEKSTKEVFKLLNVKCQICHRIQEPFMVLKKTSAFIGARTIYRMVFQMRTYQRETRRE